MRDLDEIYGPLGTAVKKTQSRGNKKTGTSRREGDLTCQLSWAAVVFFNVACAGFHFVMYFWSYSYLVGAEVGHKVH